MLKHPDKWTVWCRFSIGKVITPYFFENDVGQMNTNFFYPELNAQDTNHMWFSIGCSAHASLNILLEQFDRANSLVKLFLEKLT